jgi:hypothetical protein
VHGGGEQTWVALELAVETAPRVLAVFNLDDAQEIVLPAPPTPWELRLSTDARRWGGTGHEPAWTVTPSGIHLAAPAWSALLYRRPVG